MPQFILLHANSILATLDSPKLLNAYTLTQKDGHPLRPLSDDDSIILEPVGEGTFGSVYRAIDKLRIPRALKVFRPGDLGIADDPERHEREMKLTNATVFKHVLRITDYCLSEDTKGLKYGVYVMDFIGGPSLAHFFRNDLLPLAPTILEEVSQRNGTYKLLFALLDQIVSGIHELHEAKVVHMDIKPTNILMLRPSADLPTALSSISHEFSVFISDLGAGKKLDDDRSGSTQLIFSPRYFPQQLLPELGYHHGKVPYERLLEFGVPIDLYCFARTLEDLLFDCDRRLPPRGLTCPGPVELERSKEEFWRAILGPEFEILEFIVDELLRPKESTISSAAILKERLSKISRREAADASASEVLSDRYAGIRVRVSRDLVHVAKPLDQIVDHPMFQRLRNINQLTYIRDIFPGATHSRFAHSLLAFHLAKRFLRSLNRVALFRYHFDKADIDTVLVGALLHDLGQYPFAHTIEDLRKKGDLCDTPALKVVLYDEEVFERFVHERFSTAPPIAVLLSQLDVDPGNIQQLILKKELPIATDSKTKIAREIINGTIDVDRVSYLMFDSYMTGIPYGQGIDLESLVEALTIRWDEPAHASGLAIEEFGVSAAEMVLAAVYWMYRNVYWHHTNRGFMAAVKYVVERLLRSDALSFDAYIDATLQLNDQEALRWLADRYEEKFTEMEFNPIASPVAGSRLAYSRVISIAHRGMMEADVYTRIVGAFSDKRMETLRRLIADSIGRPYVENDPEILIDVPLKSRLHRHRGGPSREAEATEASAGAGVRLWVHRKRQLVGSSEVWQSIQEYSGLAQQVIAEEAAQGRKIRIFLSDRALSRVSGLLTDRSRLERVLLDRVADEVRTWVGK